MFIRHSIALLMLHLTSFESKSIRASVGVVIRIQSRDKRWRQIQIFSKNSNPSPWLQATTSDTEMSHVGHNFSSCSPPPPFPPRLQRADVPRWPWRPSKPRPRGLMCFTDRRNLEINKKKEEKYTTKEEERTSKTCIGPSTTYAVRNKQIFRRMQPHAGRPSNFTSFVRRFFFLKKF